eukprot:g31088.t1
MLRQKLSTWFLFMFKQRLAPYCEIHPGAMEAVCQLAAPFRPNKDVFCDLGCGDGRVVIEVAKRFNVPTVGVEINSTIADTARRRVEEAGLGQQVRIVEADLTRTDLANTLADCTILNMFLSEHGNLALRPQLERYLCTHADAGARLTSVLFPMPGWQPADQIKLSGGTKVYLYNATSFPLLNLNYGSAPKLR